MERGQARLRFLDKWFGIPLTVPAAVFRRLDRKAKNSPRRIGILCPGAIGDLLLVTALVDGIKKAEPGCILEIIASSANASALPLLPEVDRHFSVPVRAVGQLISHIRSCQFDILFDTCQWARLGSLVSAFSGAGLIAGFKTPGQCRALPYDIAVQHDPNCHEVENFLALGRAIWPDLQGKPSIAASGRGKWHDARTIYCHMWAAPGKGRELKQWPASYWAQLIRHLLNGGYAVSLTGSPNDADDCVAFLDKYFPGETAVTSLAGKTSLPELAPLFQEAAAVVSVNTGVMHLAALTGAPTIGLHGATNPRRWGPLGEKTTSLLPRKGEYAYLNLGFEYPPCVKNSMPELPVEDVLNALRTFEVAVG